MKIKYIAHCRKKDGELQSLWLHLEEVSKKSGEFALKIGLKDSGELIGLLHDIGKASCEFDQYIRSAVGLINPDEDDYIDTVDKKGKIDHSTAGAQLIYKTISGKGNEALFTAQVLSLCIASHHSGLLDCISTEGQDIFSRRMRKPEDKSHTDEVWGKIITKIKDESTRILQSKELVKDIVDCFKKLKTEGDSRETLSFKCGLLIRFIYSCLIDADRLDTADFEMLGLAKLRNYGKYEAWSVLIDKMNAKLADFGSPEGINVIRQKISQACYNFAENKSKGLYQLTIPTGGGKTFSSLRFALKHADKHRMDRIIYVLPYTTIIDQNAEEIRKVLEEKDNKGRYLNRIVLEHHSNLMPDKETTRQKVLSENWDAPIVLTTNVQILEALFGSGTRGARRMHQLANAVIIFDEIQAIPIRCVHMFNTAVNFLVNTCGSTVVLCTATQPLLDKIEPKSRALPLSVGQQMISNTKQLFTDLKRVEVFDERKVGGWTNVEIAELAEQRITETGSVLVVVNTKNSAREIYILSKQIKNIEVYHLSTYMCPAHRIAVLNRLKLSLSNKKRVICISTQLIEAGVDISFGSVIRFLAGLDSIAQAAGRCNRHNEYYPKLGKVSIINPADENIDALEDIKIGKEKTERLLDEFKNNPEKFGKDILSPEMMEQYYQYYFFQRKDEMNYSISANSVAGQEDNLFNLLSVNSLSIQEYKRINKSEPSIPLKQAFMTASKLFQSIENTAQGIIVQYKKAGKEIVSKLCSVQELDKQYKLLRLAQRYSVNVFSNVLEKLQKQGAIYEVQKGAGIFYLDEQYYSDEFGLSEISVKDLGLLNA